MYHPGLKGIIVTETKLSHIDGKNGTLIYRGTSIQHLVKNNTFEEVAYFLLYGKLPTNKELAVFNSTLKDYRKLPNHVKTIIDSLPKHLSMMDVLRTAISSLASDTDAIQLIAIMPTIIAYRYRSLSSMRVIEPDSYLNHVENFLTMLVGSVNKSDVKMLESYMIMTMEHGMNASTFSARVTISTQSDLIAAVTSALGTMKGPLHGGAPSGVIELLEEIGTENNISEVITKKLENNKRIMGFGHRVYKTFDPRAEALKDKIIELADIPDWIDLAFKTEQETIRILKAYKPDQKLYTNVEYYAAAIMKSLELDSSLFTAIFSSSRIVGWCAHATEQINNNTIFRPAAKYIGEK
ncbi:citrate/2-methylcitrate synthase [Virgibacillus sp. JSM 102003]|uniref:citrate/2-methylcitrate synthase n=1 Tax=Virgibacillus sp. JSM 102003 TaxID=1562108 RepID=UPI0035BF1093